MKKFAFAIVSAASIALAGCGGSGDDTLAENVQENMEGQADNLDALAGNAATDAEAEALGNQAEQLRDEGNAREEAIDEADVTNAAEADQAVNGM
jgi:predicted kinase